MRIKNIGNGSYKSIFLWSNKWIWINHCQLTITFISSTDRNLQRTFFSILANSTCMFKKIHEFLVLIHEEESKTIQTLILLLSFSYCSFGSNDASVVCSQLGFQTEGAIGLRGSYYGEGTGPIFIDEIDCSPDNDAVLASCFASDIGDHNCDHQEDASVMCQGK